jgi:hypothetical protein
MHPILFQELSAVCIGYCTFAWGCRGRFTPRLGVADTGCDKSNNPGSGLPEVEEGAALLGWKTVEYWDIGSENKKEKLTERIEV